MARNGAQCAIPLVGGHAMSVQRMDLPNLNLKTLEAYFVTEPVTSKEDVKSEKEQAVPDEFEIRRRLFFSA
jgi:hypothetical protein